MSDSKPRQKPIDVIDEVFLQGDRVPAGKHRSWGAHFHRSEFSFAFLEGGMLRVEAKDGSFLVLPPGKWVALGHQE